MSESRFSRSSMGPWLLELADRDGIFEVRLDPPASAFAERFALAFLGGRVAVVPRGGPSVERALAWMAISTGGSAVRLGEPPARLVSASPLVPALAEAERVAVRVLEAAESVGGLSAVLRPRPEGWDPAPPLPEAAAALLRRVDGARTVAAVLAGSKLPPELAAEVLFGLVRDRFVAAPQRPLPHRAVRSGLATTAVRSHPAPAADVEPAREEDLDRELLAAAGLGIVPWRTGRGRPAYVDRTGDEDAPFEGGARRRWAWGVGGAALLGFFLFAAGPFVCGPKPPPPPVEVAAAEEPPPPLEVAPEIAPSEPEPKPVEVKVRRRPGPVRPKGPGAELDRAEALLEAGEPEPAEAILAELRPQWPRIPRLLRLSAQAAIDLRQQEEALGHAKRALSLAPRSFETHVVYGSALQFAGQRREAAAAYRRALELDEAHPRADELRAVLRALENP